MFYWCKCRFSIKSALLVQMQLLGSHTRLLMVLYTTLPRVIDCRQTSRC